MNYKELKEFLIECSNSYYVDSISLISDYEFDMKMKELEEMEEKQGFRDPDSPTIKPGSDLTIIDFSNKHGREMLSLENTYNIEEVAVWFEKMKDATGKDPEIVLEDKYDGGSCAIRFKNGKVEKALTRGDGVVGEDITQNVSLLDWSKISKTFSGEVRGELIITKSGFAILNKDGKYQNARNLLSGSMKLLDSTEFKQRAPHIKFYAYWNENSSFKKHSDSIKALHDAGFETSYPRMKFANSVKDLEARIDDINKEKGDLDYIIDGAVMKLNDSSLWNKIGSTAKFPRWAKAYKYQQENAETTVLSIKYEVGRTGKITPLCFFKPVFIDGSTIEKATLNNKDFLDKMNIGVGDKILVQKAACIIPQIICVSDRKGRTAKAQFPTKCPTCGSKLEKLDPAHADFYCLNNNCPDRVCDTIMNFTHSMEIDGFAEIVIAKIHARGLLNSIGDIYYLKNNYDKLCIIDRFGRKMVDNLLENIEKSKSQSLDKLIAGLGIRNVGPKLAKTLAKKFKSLKVLAGVSKEDLMEIDDIGEIVADSVIKYFSSNENKKIIRMLEDAGVNMEMKLQEGEKPHVNLDGKTFCITGALSITRDRYIDLIETLGGKVVNSVSKKTSYLITNNKNSGSSKNRAAQSLGIPVLNERELLEMCEELELLKELNI